MQDIAPVYTAKTVRKWLEDIGVDVLNSPYRPDLNSIRHLWSRLRKLIYQVKPDIGKVGGSAAVHMWCKMQRGRHWSVHGVLLEKIYLVVWLDSVESRVDADVEADS